MTSVSHSADSMAARRRRLLVLSAVPVLLVLCVAAKLLSLGLLGAHAVRAYDAKDAASVRAAAEGLRLANVFEPHKAPFAAGDADILAGDFGAARLRFEEALDLVPAGQTESAEACVVRVNLVLTIERLGDEKLGAEDPASAAGLFQEALAAVTAAPEGCFSAGLPEGTGDMLTGAEARLQEKLAAAGQESIPDAGLEPNQAEETGQGAAQSKLEQLEDSARQAQRERNSGREREEYLGDTEYGSGPERPW